VIREHITLKEEEEEDNDDQSGESLG